MMQYTLIGRGKNGWHSDGLSDGNKCSSSGGTLEHYLAEAQDGTPIYDADEAEDSAFIDFIFRGPMVDPTLPSGQVSHFGEHKALLGMLPGLKGGFASLGVMALADIASLDFVAVDVYVTMLRERVPGVKIGQVVNHQVEWEVTTHNQLTPVRPRN